ncbi:MAG: type II toxin-antitoxin system HicB family antitoxin [Gemmataceae bacterium]
MRKKSPRSVSLAYYIAEILKHAVYEKGEQLNAIVAEAPDMPGCLTQGATFEEARKNLRGCHRGLAAVWLAEWRRSAGGKWLPFGHHRGAEEVRACPASTPYQGVSYSAS